MFGTPGLYGLMELCKIPDYNYRMIRMSGYITQSEIALGDETDNVFIKRANETSEIDPGIVFEADDSTPEDV